MNYSNIKAGQLITARLFLSGLLFCLAKRFGAITGGTCESGPLVYITGV